MFSRTCRLLSFFKARPSNTVPPPQSSSTTTEERELAVELKKTLMDIMSSSSDSTKLRLLASKGLELLSVVSSISTVVMDKDVDSKEAIANLWRVFSQTISMAQHYYDAVVPIRRVEQLSMDIDSHINAIKKLEQDVSISDFCRTIVSLLMVYKIDLLLDMESQLREAHEMQQRESVLAELGYGASLTYELPVITGCMNGTRVQVFDKLHAWATDVNSPQVCWLQGMAGIGKTTIISSFCESLSKKGILCGRFFYSPGNGSVSVSQIIPTLVLGLTWSCPPLKEAIFAAVEGQANLEDWSITKQFNQLLFQPASSVLPNSDKTVVLVVDALSQCTPPESAAEFLDVLFEHARVSPLPFKILISSRPEAHIRQKFLSNDTLYSNLDLHDLGDSTIDGDIHFYFQTKLKGLMLLRSDCTRKSHSDWPTAVHLETLTQLSSKLFAFAEILYNYIQETGGDPTRRMEKLFNSEFEAKPMSTLVEKLYQKYPGIPRVRSSAVASVTHPCIH